MNRNWIFRAAAVLLALVLTVAAAFGELLNPTARGKAMDAIRAKYYALESLPLDLRRSQTAEFAKTLPEILASSVTEDGNIACIFKDYVPYMILGNYAAQPPKDQGAPNLLARMDLRASARGLTAAEAPGLPGVLKAAVLARGFSPRASGEPKARPLTRRLEPATPDTSIQAPVQFEANDLPDSLNVRIANALGKKAFGDSSTEVRKILSSKGYSVAAGEDASIATLMGIKDLGVFYMQCHGGNGLVWDRLENKHVLEYILVSGEEWSAEKEKDMEDLVPLSTREGLMSGGYLGTCEALFDLDANNKEINKRWFTITRKFIRSFWKFSKNSFVLIYGCTTTRVSDVMAEPSVNASVYCGLSDLGHPRCHKWIKLLFDRMTGTNDDTIPPAEEGVSQRPFDWVKLFADFKNRKKLWPTIYQHEGKERSPSPIFRPNRDNFGLLTPSIMYMQPVAYRQRLELLGIFGKDPGEGNRRVEIAGVAQVVEKWGPDKITVLLADNAFGASGEVRVFHKGRPSNSRWLSKWTGKIGLTIKGDGSLLMKVNFQVDMIGDPWSYREQPGVKPVDQLTWIVYTTTSSTCTWNASGEDTDYDGRVLRAWRGEGQPKCWVDNNMGRKNTFGVGGVADSWIKKINIYPAINGSFTHTDSGNAAPNTPIKLGDWMQGQTLFQAKYDSDFNIIGDRREIDDEPSRLSYGAHSAVLVWDNMQCRYGMPKIAPR